MLQTFTVVDTTAREGGIAGFHALYVTVCRTIG
jgi:hypothetical protein